MSWILPDYHINLSAKPQPKQLAMKIKNIDGLSPEDLLDEAARGGRFIYYSIAFSLLVITFRRKTDVYLLRAGEKAIRKGLPYSLLTAIFGWWGFPYGPKYTFKALRTNLGGGIDVTDEVLSTVEGHILFREEELRRKAS